MTLTPSTMLELGTPAPDFTLPDTSGQTVSLRDFDDANMLVVMFLCNHCPFVIHIRDALSALVRRYRERGVAFVAINANDAARYPDDTPEKMAEAVREHDLPYPYLFDETQDVAKAYRAACTPDFFVFDHQRRLAYRGRFDGAKPGNKEPVTGNELAEALDDLLAGKNPDADQRPSMGCNIKWKPGNEPE